MPALFEETESGFKIGGIIGLYADNDLSLDGTSLRQLACDWLEDHSVERAGGGQRSMTGAIITVEFTDQFHGPRG